MTDLAELVAGWIYAVRITSWQQWLLRLTVLGSGAGAAALCWAWFPVVISTALLVTAVLLAALSAVRPDSSAPLVHAGVVGLWWLAGGADGVWWQWLAVAALVGVFHLTAALAAAAPSWAVITRRAGARMSRAVAGFAAVGVAAGGAVLAVTSVPAGALGPWWVVAGGADGVWWQWLAVAALVGVFHLTAALAAAAPSWAVITRRAGARMSRAVAGFVAVGVAAGGAVLAVTSVPAGALGPWWVVAGALAVTGAAVALAAALRRS